MIIKKGWHSIYGLVIQIKNYIKQKYDERKEYVIQNPTTSVIPLDNGNFTISSSIILKIFDRRFRNMITLSLDCIRMDVIPTKAFSSNNLETNFRVIVGCLLVD